MTGSHSGAAAQAHVDRVRVYTSLDFERRGDIDVAFARLLEVIRVAVLLNLEQLPHVALWRAIEVAAPSRTETKTT